MNPYFCIYNNDRQSVLIRKNTEESVPACGWRVTYGDGRRTNYPTAEMAIYKVALEGYCDIHTTGIWEQDLIG